MKAKPVSKTEYRFFCPGCQRWHVVNDSWGFNGNWEKPTFTPSVLVTYDGADADQEGRPSAVCHSFVTDGRIRFLQDSTHALRNQTVELPDVDQTAT